jgi:hypothetical protein
LIGCKLRFCAQAQVSQPSNKFLIMRLDKTYLSDISF